MEINLQNKLRIAFKYGMKAKGNNQDSKGFDEDSFNKAIAVINRLYTGTDK
jgi:hypothetical protein